MSLTQCYSIALIPATFDGKAVETGYPPDAVARCCRSADHGDSHLAVLPLANAPGTVSFTWPVVPQNREAVAILDGGL